MGRGTYLADLGRALVGWVDLLDGKLLAIGKMSEVKRFLQPALPSIDLRDHTSHHLVRLISHRAIEPDHCRAARLGMAALSQSGVSPDGR